MRTNLQTTNTPPFVVAVLILPRRSRNMFVMRVRLARNCEVEDLEWLGMSKHQPRPDLPPSKWIARAGGKLDMPVFVLYLPDIVRVARELKGVVEVIKALPSSAPPPSQSRPSSLSSPLVEYSFDISISSVKTLISSAPPFNVFDEYHLSSLQDSIVLFAEKMSLRGTQASNSLEVVR